MAAAGYSNQQDSDLTFTANLQDNVSDVADQIQKKLQALGATKAQIKIAIQAVDQASDHAKRVSQNLKTIPKSMQVKIQAHADDAHREIARIREVAKKPIEIPLKIAHKLDDELHAAHEKIRIFKQNVAQTLVGMPLIGSVGQAWQQTGAPMIGAAASGLGIGGISGMAAGGIGAAGAAAGGVALMQKSFDVNNQLQQSVLQLTTVIKDQAQAQKDMQRLSVYNQHTGFPIQDTRQAYTTLRAMGVPEASPIGIKQVTDAAAATGRSQNDVALAAAAAMRGDMSRLGGLGIPISTQAQLAARFPGQSPERAISSLFNQQFGGAGAIQAQTMSGITQRIKDTIQTQLIGPGGAQAFGGVQGIAGNIANKMGSVPFQRDAGAVVQKVQEGVAHLWQVVQKGVEYFKVNLEEPLKRVMKSVVEIGKIFAQTFGGVVMTGLKTLASAFTAVMQPLTKFISAHPMLVQMFAIMKAFQMLGMNKMASPFENFFKSINPLTFSVTGLIKSIGQLVMLAPKLAILFTIKHMLDMHSATQALTDSFKKFGEDGGTAIDKLQVKLDIMSGTLGQSASSMKRMAAEVAGIPPPHVGAQQRSNFALRGAENIAIMQQQGFGGQAHQMYLQQLKLDQRYTSGGADRAFAEVTNSIRGVSKALDIDLKTATTKTADALTMFSQQLNKIGGHVAPGAQGGGLAAVLQGSITGPLTKHAIQSGFANPAALVTQMLSTRAGPGPDFLQALGPQNVQQAFNFGGNLPAKDAKQLQGYQQNFADYRTFIRQYQDLAKQVGLKPSDIVQPRSSFARFFGSGIGTSDINSPEKLATQYTKSSNTVTSVEKAMSAATQKSQQFQLQQEELGELQARVNQKFEIFQHTLVPLQRGIENTQLAMNRFAFAALRPLQREMERLQNATEVYQHKTVVPIQRAQEDWNHTMQQTARRVEDVSFAVGKAQFNMDKWTQGLMTGEQAVLDNLHSLDLYNKQLQMLQLQNMSMQAQLTRTTVGEGYKEVVSPLMGFSLQRQIELNQRRQQIAQGQYDLTYGEQHYQLQKGARGVRERTELPFDQRMQGVKANLPVIDKALQQNRDLQDIQYQQALHMRTLEDRMYRATVGARKFEDAQFALSQKMFGVNQQLQDMQDNLTSQQLHLEDVQRGGRKYEDQLWKIQKPLTAVNIELMKVNKETQALDNVLNKARQIKGTLGDALNAEIAGPRSSKQFGDQMIRIAGIMEKQHLISKDQYDEMVSRVHKFEDQAGRSANRHVSIWKRAWDEISGDFVGIFTGDTWIKIYDTVKHGIESVFGHGAIGKILGNVGGIGAAGAAGIYGINAVAVGAQRGAARLVDRMPIIGREGRLVRGVRSLGGILGSNVGNMSGEGGMLDTLRYAGGRLGQEMEGFSGFGDMLRAGAAKETLLRPWLRFGGTAIDAAGGLLGAGLGHPGLGYMAGKAYSSAYEHRMVPGPITAARRFFGRGVGTPGAELRTSQPIAGGAGPDVGAVIDEAGVVARSPFAKLARGAGKALPVVGTALAAAGEGLDIANIVQHPSRGNIGNFIEHTLGQAPIVGGVGQAIGGIIKGDSIRKIIQNAFLGTMGFLGPVLADGTKKAFDFLVSQTGRFINTVTGFFKDIFTKAFGAIGDLGSTIGDFFSNVFGHPEKIGRTIGKLLISGLKLGIKALLFIGVTLPLEGLLKIIAIDKWVITHIAKPLAKFLIQLPQHIIGAGVAVAKIGVKIVEWILKGIGSTISHLWHWAGQLGGWLFGKITSGKTYEDILKIGLKIPVWIVSGIWSAMTHIADWITKLPGWMLDKVGKVASGIAGFGAKIAEGILKGLESGLSDFGTWIANTIIDAIPGPVKDFLGIHKAKTKEEKAQISRIDTVTADIKAGKYGALKPKHASGLEHVPYDDYEAVLHKGEMVLTAAEAHHHRTNRYTPHRASSAEPSSDADMSKKQKSLKEWETRVTQHHKKLAVDDDRHKKDRDNVDDYWDKLRRFRRDDYIKTTQNKYTDHYKWSLDNQKQNLQSTQTQQDTGWSSISSITAGWISKVEAEIKKIDSDLGITIDKKGNAHAPAKHAHGGLVKGGMINKGQLIRVGEEGFDEAVIPLAPHRRDRAVSLIRQTLARMGKGTTQRRGMYANGGILSFANGGLTGPRGTGAAFTPITNFMKDKFALDITAGRTDHPFNTIFGGVSDHSWGGAADYSDGVDTPHERAAFNFWDSRMKQTIKQMIHWHRSVGADGDFTYGPDDHFNHIHLAILRKYAFDAPRMAEMLSNASKGMSISDLLKGGSQGGGQSFSIPSKLQKLLDHPPYASLLRHGVAGKRDARVLSAKHRAWQHRINNLGSAHSSGGTGSNAGVTALPGEWFRVGATIDPTQGQAPSFSAHGGFSFAELLVAGANSGLRSQSLSHVLGNTKSQYGMGMETPIWVRMPNANKMFKIWKNDVGSGQSSPHFKVDLHQAIANALGWHPNEDIDVHKAAQGGIFGAGSAKVHGHSHHHLQAIKSHLHHKMHLHSGKTSGISPGAGLLDTILWSKGVFGGLGLPGGVPPMEYKDVPSQFAAVTNFGAVGQRMIDLGKTAHLDDNVSKFVAIHELAHEFQNKSVWPDDPNAFNASHDLREGAADAFAYSFANKLGYSGVQSGYPAAWTQAAQARGKDWVLKGQFSAAGGLDRVPYDNFPAMLHKDEKVSTVHERNKVDQQLDRIEGWLRSEQRSQHPSLSRLGKTEKALEHFEKFAKAHHASTALLKDIHKTLLETKTIHQIALMDSKVRGTGQGSLAGQALALHTLHADQGPPGSLGYSEGGAGTSALIQRERATPHGQELTKRWKALGIGTANINADMSDLGKKLRAATGKKKAKLRASLHRQITAEHKKLLALRGAWNSDLKRYEHEALGRGTGIDVIHQIESMITGDNTIHSDVQDPALSVLGDPAQALKNAAKAIKGKLPGYASGTDHIRHSHTAKVHRGEAVLTSHHARKLRKIAEKIRPGGLSNLGALIDYMHKQSISQSGMWASTSYGAMAHGNSLDYLSGVDPFALAHHTSVGDSQYQDEQGDYYGGVNVAHIQSADVHSRHHISNLSKLHKWMKKHPHKMPHYAAGGVAAHDGLAMLHKSEVILPPGAKSGDSILKELRDTTREGTKIQKDISIRQIDEMVRGKARNPLEGLIHISNELLDKIYRKTGQKQVVTLAGAAAMLKVDDATLHADLLQARADLKAINRALEQNSGDMKALVGASTMSHKDLSSLLKVVNDTNVTAKTHSEILKAIRETQKAIKEQGAARTLELKAHKELLRAHRDTLNAIRLLTKASHDVHKAQHEVSIAIRDTHKAHVDLAKGQAALRKAMHETAKTHAQIAKKHHDIAVAQSLIHKAHLEATKAHHETTKALHDTAKAHHETAKAHKVATIAHHETTRALRDQTIAHHATTKALHDTLKAHHDTTKALHDVARDHRDIHKGHVQLHAGHAATAANHRDIHNYHVAIHGDHLNHARYQTGLHSTHLNIAGQALWHHGQTSYYSHRGAGHLHSIARGASSGYAGGLPNVPSNMIARLHAGETVLNPGEAQTYKAMRAGTMGGTSGIGGSTAKLEALLAAIHETLRSTKPEISVSTTAVSPKVQTNVIHKYSRSK